MSQAIGDGDVEYDIKALALFLRRDLVDLASLIFFVLCATRTDETR